MNNTFKNICFSVFAILLLQAPVWGQATTFKIATLAPEGTDWMKQMKAGAKAIKADTDGRVVFKFYGGGVMGNDKKVMRKMRNGQLHGGAFTTGSLAERYNGMNTYGLPFLFDSLEEVDLVRAQLDSMITAGLRDKGLVSFGMASGGFAHIMSNEPVRSIDDLKGKRVWVPEGDKISYAAMERFGLSPVTLPVTDVLTGLQTGLIDVIGASAIGALVLQWHTKVSHVSTMPVSYLVGIMAIENKYFERISSADQAVVTRVFEKVYADLEKQNNVDNEKAMAALISTGAKAVKPEDGLLKSLKEDARELSYEMVKQGIVPAEHLDAIETILKQHRSALAASE